MDDREPRVVVVTGAGAGAGRAIARRFAREGLVACVTRRTADKLAPLVEQIQADGGEAHGFASDARKELDVETLVAHIEREVARLGEAGAAFRNPIVEGPGGKQVLLQDPSNNFVELFQPAGA